MLAVSSLPAEPFLFFSLVQNRAVDVKYLQWATGPHKVLVINYNLLKQVLKWHNKQNQSSTWHEVFLNWGSIKTTFGVDGHLQTAKVAALLLKVAIQRCCCHLPLDYFPRLPPLLPALLSRKALPHHLHSRPQVATATKRVRVEAWPGYTAGPSWIDWRSHR